MLQKHKNQFEWASPEQIWDSLSIGAPASIMNFKPVNKEELIYPFPKHIDR